MVFKLYKLSNDNTILFFHFICIFTFSFICLPAICFLYMIKFNIMTPLLNCRKWKSSWTHRAVTSSLSTESITLCYITDNSKRLYCCGLDFLTFPIFRLKRWDNGISESLKKKEEIWYDSTLVHLIITFEKRKF